MMYYKYMVKVAKRIWLWLKAHRKTSNACKVLVNKAEDGATMKKNLSKELDETKAIPTDEQPTLSIVDAIPDFNGNFIKPGFYELALSNDREFLYLIEFIN